MRRLPASVARLVSASNAPHPGRERVAPGCGVAGPGLELQAATTARGSKLRSGCREWRFTGGPPPWIIRRDGFKGKGLAAMNSRHAGGRSLQAILRPAEVLFIVPPFALLDRPALGVHLLQAVARRAGVEAQVLYTNLWFAACFDEGTHSTVTKLQHGLFLGERLFARAAFGGPALGRDGGEGLHARLSAVREGRAKAGAGFTLGVGELRALEAEIPGWLDSFAPHLAAVGYPIVGCTSSFEQNGGSIAILSRLKELAPQIVTLMGGANCEGEMAEGIRSLSDRVDYVFSGESEQTFREFLEGRQRRELPAERILYGRPCTAMDQLPTPDYADYYMQLRAFLPDRAARADARGYLAYETSRGCWWGAKSHCTFCGLNGQGMASREKSPDRVLAELKVLLGDSPSRQVVMTDNIMPHAYFRTLLPRLPDELPGVEIMYEQKANLSLEQVRALARAGVREIQPGIEALSSGLLALMAKGTTAAQNIALLRYARATRLRLTGISCAASRTISCRSTWRHWRWCRCCTTSSRRARCSRRSSTASRPITVIRSATESRRCVPCPTTGRCSRRRPRLKRWRITSRGHFPASRSSTGRRCGCWPIGSSSGGSATFLRWRPN